MTLTKPRRPCNGWCAHCLACGCLLCPAAPAADRVRWLRLRHPLSETRAHLVALHCFGNAEDR